MSSIIEDLKHAIPGRETDGDIAEALGLCPKGKNWKRQQGGRWVEFNGTIGQRWPEWEAPLYTTSLDAAVSLYEERPDRILSTPMEVCQEAVALRLGAEPDAPATPRFG